MTVRTACSVRPSEILAIVHREVQMMQCVMRRAVDHVFERMAGNHVRVVDKDAPKVDSNEEAEVELAVQREEENEEVVRHGLRVPVDWVKRMRCERGWNCSHVSMFAYAERRERFRSTY